MAESFWLRILPIGRQSMTLSELEEIMANDTDDTRCGNHVGLDEPMDIIIDCDGTVSITYVDGRITISRSGM